MKSQNSDRGSFGSKFGIIAATAGSAIGLGNIWRFPYIVGENGGGAFLLIYLLFIVVIGVPVMISELSLGRLTQRNAFGTFKTLRPKSHWYLVGVMGIIAAGMILSFYNVVAGWTLEYLFSAVGNQFKGQDAVGIQQLFDTFVQSGARPIVWGVVFMVITAAVVLMGVEKGIEKYTKLLMPLLFILIIVLDIRAITLPNASEGLSFLFKPDFSKITTSTVIEALGQAFFSLSIGMGTLITYGSYIRKKENMATTSMQVAIADTLVAILAGVAIFPAVFAFGISPSSGPALVFVTLPNIFAQMGASGYIFSILFFFLLVVAALTSSISILEVVVAFCCEELKMTRKKATIVSASIIMVFSILCSLSLHHLPQLSLFGMNLFDLFDFVSSNLLLPLGGLCIVLFIGFYTTRDTLYNELSSQGLYKIPYFKIYRIIVRYVAPLAIVMVFLNGIGLF